ncbi:MAG: alpha-amylase family glycosyl hydrolase [Pseudomonadaceae bacterium]|nr:alpha-amylase family glycosyl hydrolase [Pseudomonadaceae bacterium]
MTEDSHPRLQHPAVTGLDTESSLTDSQAKYQLMGLLTSLYGAGSAELVASRMLALADGLTDELGNRRAASAGNSLDQSDVMLITYGDTIVEEAMAPLAALKQFADRYLPDSFSGIHVLPFFPFSSDDGFSVIDYSVVRSDLGDWTMIRELGEHFELMFDLVINHCSREHLWFADFVSDRAPGRDFFLSLDKETNVSEVTRPRNTPLLSEVHTYRGVRHVWTTFSDDQIDLNFSNPDVLLRFAEILIDYVRHGARFIRLDAIAFLWKRLGTACMSLPETHAVVKALRLMLDSADVPVRLLTETNVPHEENVSYFGAGDEAQLVYQFPLAPLLLYSYLFNDGSYLGRWLSELESPPAGCSFLNFIASHDGIGLRPLEGLVPEDRVDQLIDRCADRGGFVTRRTLPDGSERAYELNIALFSAFGGSIDSVPSYIAAHQLMLALQGLPAIYLHSLLGTPNDLEAVERTGRTRSVNRGRWQMSDLDAMLASEHNVHRIVFTAMTNLIALRRAQSALSPAASQTVLSYSQDQLVFERRAPNQRLLIVASFADVPSELAKPSSLATESGVLTDLLTDERFALAASIPLAAGQVRWLEHDTA